MPDLAPHSRAVAEALVSIGGVRFQPEAPLTFKSGLRSPVYCDNRRFPFHPQAWRVVIEGFEALIAEQLDPSKQLIWAPERTKSAWHSLTGLTWEGELDDPLRGSLAKDIPAAHPITPWIGPRPILSAGP